jgi:hypothetical protein
MTAQAQARHLAKLEAELLSFERQLEAAQSTRDYQHTLDRVTALRADIARARTGRWVGPS